MKKSATLESGIRQPRAGGVRKGGDATAPAAKGLKLSPARKREPAGLLEADFAKDGEAQMVTFEYFNPAAGEVLVAASFNDWEPRATPMKKERGGKWSTGVLLPPGQYEYRFVVDGLWRDDPMAARFVANPFGGLNCVVEVERMQTPAKTRP